MVGLRFHLSFTLIYFDPVVDSCVDVVVVSNDWVADDHVGCVELSLNCERAASSQ